MLAKYARVDVSTPMFASYLQTVEEVDDNSRWMLLLQNLVSSTPACAAWAEQSALLS